MPESSAPQYHALVRALALALRRKCEVPSDACLVIGCSGGADSVALLRGLKMLSHRRRWGLRLVVGHVHHHLREEAEQEAEFVKQLAQSLSLPYARRDIAPREMGGNLEASARVLRYRALAEIACEYDASWIATAHHADDQLETVLMRLLRGAGVGGLRGIAWRRRLRGLDEDRRVDVIRPMLGVPKQEVHALLKELGQPWCEDATNRDTSRTRARLRHEVIPLIKTIEPDAAERAGDFAEHCRELYSLIQEAVDQPAYHGCDELPGDVLGREQARQTNPAVLYELIRRALLKAGAKPDRLSRRALTPAVHAAQDTVGGTRTFAFAPALRLTITRGTIRITRQPTRTTGIDPF